MIEAYDNTFARLRWQCRRGMLELDVLLQDFLGKGYVRLSGEDRQAFAQLLDYPDPVLLDYLMGHMISTDPKIAHVVAQIRRAPDA